MIKITASALETQQLAFEFVKSLKKGGVAALTGDLASGKTTFVQGVAQALGIKRRVISPTFILMRQYEVKRKEQREESKNTNKRPEIKQLVHVDLYRAEGYKDIESLGLEEIWSDPQNLVMIEWAEKIRDHLPKNTTWINFEYLGATSRQINLIKRPSLIVV